MPRPSSIAAFATRALSAVAASGTPGAARLAVAGEYAAPADITQVLRQPDGTTVRAVMTDISVGGTFEAAGYSIGKDAQGWWRYASGRDSRGRRLR